MKKLERKNSRISVRPMTLEDYNAWKDAHLTKLRSQNKWDSGPMELSDLTRANYRKLINAQKKRREEDVFYDLGVFNLKGDLVGNVSLMEVARGVSQTAFLGYQIFNNHWRQGYGKEAVKFMIDIGFKDLKLHRIEAGIEPGNIRSIKLAKTLGMRKEGLKKRAIYLRGQWVDLIMYTLTSEDMRIKFDASAIIHRKRT